MGMRSIEFYIADPNNPNILDVSEKINHQKILEIITKNKLDKNNIYTINLLTNKHDTTKINVRSIIHLIKKKSKNNI